MIRHAGWRRGDFVFVREGHIRSVLNRVPYGLDNGKGMAYALAKIGGHRNGGKRPMALIKKHKFPLTRHEKQDRSHKIVAATNAAGFAAILAMDAAHMPPLKIAGFAVGVLGNIVCLILWKKIDRFALPLLYALDAVLYATKGYGLRHEGSKLAYLFFYGIAAAYLIIAAIWLLFKKTREAKSNAAASKPKDGGV
jgi:hypothetical protein